MPHNRVVLAAIGSALMVGSIALALYANVDARNHPGEGDPASTTQAAGPAPQTSSATPTAAATAAADLAYLENYQLAPSVEQQLADARARGIEGPIHIPDAVLPPPWLKPEIHGPFLLKPQGWIGPLPNGSESRPFTSLPAMQASTPPSEAAIRASALWREPSGVPEGFQLRDVSSERLGQHVLQRWARPIAGQPGAQEVFELQWWRPYSLPIPVDTWAGEEGERLFEATEIDGFPAVVYSAIVHESSTVWIFNEDEGVVYVGQSSVSTANGMLDIVRSLYR